MEKPGLPHTGETVASHFSRKGGLSVLMLIPFSGIPYGLRQEKNPEAADAPPFPPEKNPLNYSLKNDNIIEEKRQQHR
ncbi:MAG TPA: hypothetical protein PLU82_01240 [Oscillospiraceae bacterium]|nr:hypothetical protein [Oscillospiraceae bacterium]